MGLSLKETEKLLHFVRGHPGRRQVGDLHRPQHLPRLLGGGPDRRPRPRAGGGRVPDRRATRSRSSWTSCERSPRRGAYTEPSRYRGRGRSPAPQPGPSRERAAAAPASSARAADSALVGVHDPLGVADRHHRRVPAALAGVHRPGAGRRSCRDRIYLSFAQTTPVLRAHRDAPDDGHRRRRHRPLVPVDHGPGHGRLRVGLGGHRQRRARRRRGVLASAPLAGLFNGLVVTMVGHPVAGRDHRHPVPVPWTRRWCSSRARARRSSDTEDSRLRPPGREALRDPDGVLVAGAGTDRRLGAAQPPPPRAERLRHRRQPPGRPADGHPDPADPHHAVRADRRRGRVRRAC